MQMGPQVPRDQRGHADRQHEERPVHYGFTAACPAKGVFVKDGNGNGREQGGPDHGVITPRPAGGADPLRDAADSGVLEESVVRVIWTCTLYLTCARAK